MDFDWCKGQLIWPQRAVEFQRPNREPWICFHYIATAVKANSHQDGPPILKVVQLGLTKIKPYRAEQYGAETNLMKSDWIDRRLR